MSAPKHWWRTLLSGWRARVFKRAEAAAAAPSDGIVGEIVKTNSEYWRERRPATNAGTVLVEGFLGVAGPNYTYRTALAAKALEDKFSLESVVVLGDLRREANIRRVYESFNIHNFMELRSSGLLKNLFFAAQALWVLCATRGRIIRCPFEVKFKSIVVGDLLYDDLLRHQKKPTLKSIGIRDLRVFFRLVRTYSSAAAIIARTRPAYTVVTHYQYVAYGVFARLAVHMGSNLVVTTDVDSFVLDAKDWSDTPITYHGMVAQYGRSLIATLDAPARERLVDAASAYLDQRFKGELAQIDVMLAFRDKKRYEIGHLREELGFDANPIAVVMCHIFSDACHCSPSNNFGDYYEWLCETLQALKQITDVNWLVKPHPAAKVYGEEGMVERLVEELGCPHVKCPPRDFGTHSLLEIADYVVTMTGTAGLEFSVLGKPVLLAGAPFYYNNGFTIDARSREHYFEELRNIRRNLPLDADRIRLAKLWMGVFNECGGKPSEVVTGEVLQSVWGYYLDKDLEQAWTYFCRNLKTFRPQRESLYVKIKDYDFSGAR